MAEPLLRVGLVLDAPFVEFVLEGPHEGPMGIAPMGQQLTATAGPEGIRLQDATGAVVAMGPELRLVPQDPACSFLLMGMTVGVQFHWEHKEDLRFRGGVHLYPSSGGLTLVDEVPLETYLTSVIASEMSARSPGAFLRAHAIISRSWLLAQLESKGVAPRSSPSPTTDQDGALRVVRWYDREDHTGFDVCADDHCQRYQGVTRQVAGSAPAEAVAATRGVALVHGGQVCDARFSKCCGGVMGLFSSAWSDDDPPYLQALPDLQGESDFAQPLSVEENAQAFIRGKPAAWCNTVDRELLERVLPELDHDTTHFYRWEESLSAERIAELVEEKGGISLGSVRGMRALERGPSGRITLLEIEGSEATLRVGKELEIRRLLSSSHLYSSAFVVDEVEGGFRLRGAGWGHGVGLCQIGAAVMGEAGRSHEEILAHYYPGSTLEKRY